MINLLAAEVYSNARQAYAEGRLQAQLAVSMATMCKYSGPCAIGVTWQPSNPDYDNEGIIDLVDNGYVITDDVGALADLQEAHDSWLTDKKFGREAEAEAESCFVLVMNSY